VTLETTLLVLVPFVGLAIGLALALLLPRRSPPERNDLLVGARGERDERLRAARSQALEERAEAEATARHTLSSLEEIENRLARREERLDNRLDSASAREAAIEAREAALAERASAVEAAYEEQVDALGRIRALPPETARATLLEQVAPSAREAALARADAILKEADDACREARARPSALAVQRASSELVGEFALVPVPIPREEIKGRIIGREGRNIKAFEAMTGVELVIDDAPDVVTLSGFDPFRREVARLALIDLVDDGRIHPGRIEEAVKRAREHLARKLVEDGVKAAQAAEAGQVPTELAELLGRLSLIRSGAEDVLADSVRRASIVTSLAGELRADARVCRRAALFLDIARAVGREAGGSTEAITADVLTRAGESHAVITAVKMPGELYPAITPEQAVVWLARAVAAAGLIPKDEPVARRVDAIERAAALVEGVAEALAFQVGTRVRLLIRPSEPVDTVGRVLLARQVLERIEASLGPRVGMTVALLVASRRRGGGEGAETNGAARFGSGRQQFRGRHGRRSD
jgi:ribonuclease Y